MHGRTPTAKEKLWMNVVAGYGCYCCRKNGVDNQHILIHHTVGRTKPNAHLKVIPLCAAHHDYSSPIGLHNNIGAWRRLWGREEDIVSELLIHYGSKLSPDEVYRGKV